MWPNSSLKNSEWSIKKLFSGYLGKKYSNSKKSRTKCTAGELPPTISKKLSDKNTSEVEMIKGLGMYKNGTKILFLKVKRASSVYEMVDWLK